MREGESSEGNAQAEIKEICCPVGERRRTEGVCKRMKMKTNLINSSPHGLHAVHIQIKPIRQRGGGVNCLLI